MDAVIEIIGVAFGAFCVWLAVRIVNRRERWAKWTLATLVWLPVLYVASLGPAFGLFSRHTMPEWYDAVFHDIYTPLRPLVVDGPDWVRVPLIWWMGLWV